MKVAICPPVTKPNEACTGQAEQLDQPRAGDLLDHGGRRAADVEAGVLVPGGRKPVGSERGRHRPADHEPEVAPARLGDEAGLGRVRELLEDDARVGRPLGQRAAQCLPQLVGGCFG